MRCPVVILTALAALTTPAAARVICVPESVGTIQAGISASADGDTVLVSPGSYKENVSLLGRRIVLASRFLLTGDTALVAATIIDGDHAGTVVYCGSTEDTTTVITGFTITNGEAGNGGGIYCFGGSPTIRYNIIENNSTSADGAGVMVQGEAAPIIEHNTIRHNETSAWGGGVYIFDGSSPRVRRNLIYDNGTTLESPAEPQGRPLVVAGRLVEAGQSRSPFVANGGGILVTNYTSLETKPSIHHNTIDGNVASSLGGGIYSNRAQPDIRNNIVASNQATGIYSEVTVLDCAYNDVWNNPTNYGGVASAGTGAISACPLFADSAGHDFHILAGSPCIDAGDPALPPDPDSSRADMGRFWWDGTGIAGHSPTPADARLRVWPNPFVRTAAVEPAALIEVYDAAGKLVEQASGARFGAVLGPGIYFVEAVGSGRARAVKLAGR